jgi:hypothetical protein
MDSNFVVVLLVKLGRDADHTPPSSAEVKKELSYTSTHPMGPSWACYGVPFTSEVRVKLSLSVPRRQRRSRDMAPLHSLTLALGGGEQST